MHKAVTDLKVQGLDLVARTVVFYAVRGPAPPVGGGLRLSVGGRWFLAVPALILRSNSGSPEVNSFMGHRSFPGAGIRAWILQCTPQGMARAAPSN